MTKEQKMLCEIAKQMHRYGCGGFHGRCDFDPNLDYEEWENSYYIANYVFLDMAKRAVKLMNENGVSYDKFINSYARWKSCKHISRKMEKLLIKYGIIAERKKRSLWDIIQGNEENDFYED